ncbi:MAG TPA: hypothetical protein PLV87_00415 [Opitutaceae bacterium]|nr:hypothetical protein [Opitutaceae bacterium]
MKPSSRLSAFILALAAGLAGCSRQQSHDHDHAGHNHDHGADHAHVHTAPHGGSLCALGDHQFNVEFVLDAMAGKLTAYALDAHAENFVRIAAPSLEIRVTTPAPSRTLILTAVANAATGETVGNTSQFEASADWLKGTANISGTLTRFEAQGTSFQNVPISILPVKAAGN